MISVALSGVTTMPLGNAMPSATCRTEPSGVDQGDDPGGELAAGEVEAGGVDVDVAAAVDDDLVPGGLGDSRSGRHASRASRRAPAQKAPVAPRDRRAAVRRAASRWRREGGPTPRTITSLLPSRSTAMISPAPQSENHSRPSCQRGDSPRAMPVRRVRKFRHGGHLPWLRDGHTPGLLMSWRGSGGGPRRCRNGVRPAVRASGGHCRGGTVCRLPPRRARPTGGTRRPNRP